MQHMKLLTVSNLNIEPFKAKNNIKLKANSNHLQLAYELCSNNTSNECRRYINHYEHLRNSFHKLKKSFCKKNTKQCKELGL